jgi:hypothetical protein
MATTSGTQPSAPKPGLGDLEKELVCSVCMNLGEFFVFIVFVVDMVGKTGG